MCEACSKCVLTVYNESVSVLVLGISQKQCIELFKIRGMFYIAALKSENDWAR